MPPLILNGIVKQSGYRLIFSPSEVDHHSSYREQVANIGHTFGPFTNLATVKVRGKYEGLAEAGCQHHVSVYRCYDVKGTPT
jgi:hypothetical protein